MRVYVFDGLIFDTCENEVIDIELKNLSPTKTSEIGEWLDENLPNPPLPDEQRWTLGYSTDGREGIRFFNDEDATYFLLRWS